MLVETENSDKNSSKTQAGSLFLTRNSIPQSPVVLLRGQSSREQFDYILHFEHDTSLDITRRWLKLVLIITWKRLYRTVLDLIKYIENRTWSIHTCMLHPSNLVRHRVLGSARNQATCIVRRIGTERQSSSHENTTEWESEKRVRSSLWISVVYADASPVVSMFGSFSTISPSSRNFCGLWHPKV